MAFTRSNLTILTNNVKAGVVPSLWAYYNEDGDQVTGTDYFAEGRLTVGDLIMVNSLSSVAGIMYRVSAKSTDLQSATVTILASQYFGAAGIETLTSTKLYHEISNQMTITNIVTAAANEADTFTTSATANNYVTFANDNIYDGVPMVLTTTTTLPGGLSLATTYYSVESSNNKCKLSLSRGGTPITITDAGTGTHTATVQKNFFILKDGYEGQRKVIKIKTDGGIDAVILPDNLGDGTIITCGEINDAMELVFADGNWWIAKNLAVVAS